MTIKKNGLLYFQDYEEIFIDRTLSTISEQDGDDDDDNADDDDYEDNSDDLLNASSASSDNSIEWRTETSWPWYQNDWNIFITNPKTTIEIWARLIGMEYSVSFFVHKPFAEPYVQKETNTNLKKIYWSVFSFFLLIKGCTRQFNSKNSICKKTATGNSKN